MLYTIGTRARIVQAWLGSCNGREDVGFHFLGSLLGPIFGAIFDRKIIPKYFILAKTRIVSFLGLLAKIKFALFWCLTNGRIMLCGLCSACHSTQSLIGITAHSKPIARLCKEKKTGPNSASQMRLKFSIRSMDSPRNHKSQP